MIKADYQLRAVVGNRVVTFYGDDVETISKNILEARTVAGDTTTLEEVKESMPPLQELPSAVFNKNRSPKKRAVTIKDAARAANALVKIGNGETVDKTEYLRRLEICRKCTSKSKVSDCLGCGGSGKAARIMNGIRAKAGLTYRLDTAVSVQFCKMCGCSLSVIMLTKFENYKKESLAEIQARPNNCWLKKDYPNFNGK